MHVIDTRAGAGPGGGTIDNFQGGAYGAGVSLIFENTDRDGSGPFMHQHPYSETFVVHAGRALFTVGGEQLVGEAGLVLVVPELTPHKFQVIGPERYISTHIHANDTFITEWLEGRSLGLDERSLEFEQPL